MGKRFSAEQIIMKLREEVGLAQGQRVGQESKDRGESRLWLNDGGLRLDQVPRG